MDLSLVRSWWRNEFAVGASPAVSRRFLRCATCGGVVMHYWVCKPLGERGRTGCPCGGIQVRTANIPNWLAAYYVISRYLVRKVIQKRAYWDPRMPERVVTPDA